MKNNSASFQSDCKSLAAILSMIAFALAVPFRIIGYADKLTQPMYALRRFSCPFSALF